MTDETTPITTAPNLAAATFFELQEIEVPVTYPMLGDWPAMKFYLRPLMNAEEKQLRQDYFGLKDAEREAKKHAHQVEMLARLATRMPENVPTFPTNGTPAALIREFFAGDNAMKQKLVDDVLSIYFARIQPVEFFRSF